MICRLQVLFLVFNCQTPGINLIQDEGIIKDIVQRLELETTLCKVLTSLSYSAIFIEVKLVVVCHRVEKRKHSLRIVRSLKMCRRVFIFFLGRSLYVCERTKIIN